MTRAAITLDVDGVRHYHAIHGLRPPGGGARSAPDPILERGVPRFLELCERVGVSSTVFVVGADLAADPRDDGAAHGTASAFAALVKSAARAGHEIGSHSYAHRYDLSRCSLDVMRDDVQRSVDAIASVATRPLGFRAPGYNLSAALLDVVEECGFAYDSSILPSPLYFAARAAAIGAYAVTGALAARAPRLLSASIASSTPSTSATPGRAGKSTRVFSSSIVGDAQAFARAPRRPYRLRKGGSWQAARSRVEGRELIEVPIATLLGVPWFGTALTSTPTIVNAALAAWASLSSPVLELHAIDLCDAQDGFAPELARVQRDLRVPVKAKLQRIETVLRVLAQTSDVVTLDVMARAP